MTAGRNAARGLALCAAMVLFANPANAQTYRFPTTPADYGEFYVTAYRDHDGGGGLQDWNCGGNTYNGHNGSDFGVGGFPGMAAGRDLVAAADGTVVYVHDGEPDMCTSGACGGGGGFGNYVKITHADGKSTYYAHMATWSVAVTVGDPVTCGTFLGLVGSSGNSTGPHLHFEPRNSGGSSEDPFDGPCSAPPSYWTNQGTYNALPTMDCDGTPPPTCVPGSSVACGDAASGDLGAGGTSDAVFTYSCNSWTYAGPEDAYTFTATMSEPVTVTVTNLSADLDLLVLDGGGCDPSTCIVDSDNPNTSDEAVTFDAIAGSTYSIVVDGYEGAVSSYDIAFSCTGAPPPPPPPPPDALPDLSLSAEIATIVDQERDFVPDAESAGIFDLYTEQAVTVRCYFHNAPDARADAEAVVAGVFADLPFVGLGRWELYTNDPAAACGEEWCLDPANDLPDQPSHEDPGSDIRIALGDIAPGISKMIVLVAVGLADSSSEPEHDEIGCWIASVPDVYEKTDFWSDPALNEGQTWNGGDLRTLAEMDVWLWTGEGRPPGGIPPPVTIGPVISDPGEHLILRGVCGCRIAGHRADRPAQENRTPVVVLLAILLGLAIRSRRPTRPGRHPQ